MVSLSAFIGTDFGQSDPLRASRRAAWIGRLIALTSLLVVFVVTLILTLHHPSLYLPFVEYSLVEEDDDGDVQPFCNSHEDWCILPHHHRNVKLYETELIWGAVIPLVAFIVTIVASWIFHANKSYEDLVDEDYEYGLVGAPNGGRKRGATIMGWLASRPAAWWTYIVINARVGAIAKDLDEKDVDPKFWLHTIIPTSLLWFLVPAMVGQNDYIVAKFGALLGGIYAFQMARSQRINGMDNDGAKNGGVSMCNAGVAFVIYVVYFLTLALGPFRDHVDDNSAPGVVVAALLIPLIFYFIDQVVAFFLIISRSMQIINGTFDEKKWLYFRLLLNVIHKFLYWGMFAAFILTTGFLFDDSRIVY